MPRGSHSSWLQGALVAGLTLVGAQTVSAQPIEVVVEVPEPQLEVVVPAPPLEAPLAATHVSLEARLRERIEAHGRWFHLPPHGDVWQPHEEVVGPGFRPYSTGGQWVRTDAGWSFASNWNWGQVVFHYGRWHHTPRHGWVWVLGTEWAPAWWDRPRRVHSVVHHSHRRHVVRHHPRRHYTRRHVVHHQPRRHHTRRYQPRRHRARQYQPRRHHTRQYQPRRHHTRRYQPRRHRAPRRMIHQPRHRVQPRTIHQPPRRRYHTPSPQKIRRHRAPMRVRRSNRQHRGRV